MPAQNQHGASYSEAYIQHHSSRSETIEALISGSDSGMFATDVFGDERNTLAELLNEFGSELPSHSWVRTRLAELSQDS